MRTFTVITRTKATELPPALELLDAPVSVEEPSASGELVGRTEGAMLDEANDVVAFVMRLDPRLAGHRPPWTLIPASAVEIEPGGGVRVGWSEDQLLAQPRLDAYFQPHERVEGGLPIESQFLPARPNVVPPGGGLDGREALIEGAAGGVLGAALGTVAGLVAGGPLAAASLAVFFAAGGSLAGLLSGATQESAVQASELDVGVSHSTSGRTQGGLSTLVEELRRPGAAATAGLRTTRFDLVSSDPAAVDGRKAG